MRDLHAFLAAATVDNAVYALRPDYRAMLIVVDGIEPGPGDDTSEALLTAAEDSARRWIDQAPVEQLPMRQWFVRVNKPSGTSLVMQWAIHDEAAVHGVALSNALVGITP